jgi:hypothetical protein
MDRMCCAVPTDIERAWAMLIAGVGFDDGRRSACNVVGQEFDWIGAAKIAKRAYSTK